MTMTNEMKKDIKKQAKQDEKSKREEEKRTEASRKAREAEIRRQAESGVPPQDKPMQPVGYVGPRIEDGDRNQMRRKALARLHAMPQPVAINDEENFKSRFGYNITRTMIGSSYNCVIFPVSIDTPTPSKADVPQGAPIGQVVVKVVMLDKCFPDFRKHLMEQSLKTIKFIGQTDPNDPAGQLVHPALVRVLDVFSSDKKAYIFMERLPTKTLEDRVRNEDGLSIERIIKTSREIGDALLCLHTLGIAHLSVRLDNFVLDDLDQVRLIGLCRVWVAWNPETETVIKRHKMHEPHFRTHFPPEVFKGEFDPFAVDVFCFGAVIYNIIVRKRPLRKAPPFKGKEDMKEVWGKHCATKAEEMRVLPEEVLQLIEPMIASSRPEDRPPLDLVLKNVFFHDTFLQAWWASPAKKHFPSALEKSRKSKSRSRKKK